MEFLKNSERFSRPSGFSGRNSSTIKIRGVGKKLFLLSEPVEGLKIRGGASSNVVGIICPPVEIGLTDLKKSGGGANASLGPLALPFEPYLDTNLHIYFPSEFRTNLLNCNILN